MYCWIRHRSFSFCHLKKGGETNLTDFVLLDLPVFEPVYLPVFELFELKFEPLERPDFTRFLWPVPAKIPKSEAAADGGARGDEFEPAETERSRSHRPRAAALDHQTGDRGPRLQDGRRARQVRSTLPLRRDLSRGRISVRSHSANVRAGALCRSRRLEARAERLAYARSRNDMRWRLVSTPLF